MNVFVNYIIEINPYDPFGIFISYLFLFIVGSFLGYILEVFFRRFVSMKRWINPGFLKGPCLPLYGFGVCALHFFSTIAFKYMLSSEDSIATNKFYGIYDASGEFIIPTGTLPFWATSLIIIAIIGIAMTLLEFIAGLIFVKGLHIQLWDYSKLKGNIMGIICPLFSLIWTAVGVIYWFGIRPFITYLLYMFVPHIWGATFLIGFYYAILLVDFINSLILSIKISGQAKKFNQVVDFEKLKLNLKKKEYKNKKLSDFADQIKDSLAPTKIKIEKVANKVKASFYINNEIPTKNNSETPRTKEQENNNKS